MREVKILHECIRKEEWLEITDTVIHFKILTKIHTKKPPLRKCNMKAGRGRNVNNTVSSLQSVWNVSEVAFWNRQILRQMQVLSQERGWRKFGIGAWESVF